MASSDCYNVALRLLSRRSHFRRQLEEKLRARGYGEEDIRPALERLTDDGFLDDFRTAREFVGSRLRRGPMGRRRMRAELERRGAGDEAAELALDGVYSGSDESAAAREAAERWLGRGRRSVEALARHLDRLGFSTSSVLRVVEEVRPRLEPEDEA